MGLPMSYAARNLLARRGRVLMTSGVTGLTVLAVALVGSLITGIQAAFVQAAEPLNLVVLRKGADNESSSWISRDAAQIVRSLPGLALSKGGAPLASAELIVQPFATTRRGDQENVLIRGVEPVALEIHEKVHFTQGRMFRPGTREIIVGSSAANRYAGTELGSSLQFGGRPFQVVGVFKAEGSSFESEIWADAHQLAEDARRALPFSALYLRAQSLEDRAALIEAIGRDRRLALSALPEPYYYEKRADTANALYAILLVIVLLAGTSAVFGATNTHHAAVQARVAEIGTLRALGFSRGSIVRSLLLESVLVSMIGFVSGAALAAAIAFFVSAAAGGVGIPTSSFTTLIVELPVGLRQLAIPCLLAGAIGLLGGLVPAVKASGLKPVDALRRQ